MDKRRPVKAEYQRLHTDRKLFGGNRLAALERDGYACVRCGMTDSEHNERWGVTITVDHIDGNGFGSPAPNNDLSNLQTLCLRCHGAKDSPRGYRPECPEIWGEKHHGAKLTEADVIAMRRGRRAGATYQDLAAQYDVTTTTAYAACIGRIWRVVDETEPPVKDDHVGNTYRGERHKDAKMTWESVRALRAERRLTGATYIDLARKYGISQSGAFAICTYKVWRE